ncbi:MAG TPA: transposase [Candidatus Omnitrophica bacterium]|nr:transposase [Candidatus Omnitrophota bacterium]
MSYYSVLNLNKEPFSTSPDPFFFYPSISHKQAMQRLEIAIRLKRGLSVILGDVGIGKTTLARALIQELHSTNGAITHMILDPTYDSEFQFVVTLAKLFGIKGSFRSTLDYKEAIERFLFKRCVDESHIISLIIDEGQKMSLATLELLRTLLNYETNEYKLLQLVIVGQMELLPKLQRINNFSDRISLKYILNPLDYNETKNMIEFRLKQAGAMSGKEIFTEKAMLMIYQYTQGYPRKISALCHNLLEELVMKDRRIVEEDLVNEAIEKDRKVIFIS